MTSKPQAPRLDLLVILYGSSGTDPVGNSRFGADQRRVELKFNPRIPAEVPRDPVGIDTWARNTLAGLFPELKHSQKWHCEFCNKLARESQVCTASWTHLSPPRVVSYIHLVCDTRLNTPCGRQLKEVLDEMNSITGMPPATASNSPRVQAYFPAAASCACCESEESIDGPMSRCSKCKLIRYCGTKCQEEDWERHKKYCKMVKEVTWTWP
ncbi:hypothetical protein NM688_g3696 [Phlebia brevispora]|uniref:Uncharacterized protein n=1 Tax=Phlebia brevispora TaxID=194682 RepID=A0ACC1T573_9APHY|nr:hypothetical protein NM688_g3696 [Phlebia brevispora]